MGGLAWKVVAECHGHAVRGFGLLLRWMGRNTVRFSIDVERYFHVWRAEFLGKVDKFVRR